LCLLCEHPYSIHITHVLSVVASTVKLSIPKRENIDFLKGRMKRTVLLKYLKI